MPVHLDIEWSEAQLGQLTRIGSDPLARRSDGRVASRWYSQDAAEIVSPAIGVHRAEFVGRTNGFRRQLRVSYRMTARAVDHLTCDSPFGNGCPPRRRAAW